MMKKTTYIRKGQGTRDKGRVKKLVIFIILLTSYFLPLTSAFSQSPNGINYQAVARDVNGTPLATQAVTVVFNIHMGSGSGPVSCSETQTLTTNPFGLFTWVIGSSNHPNFDTIAWENHAYFLEVIVNGSSMGATQFVSVPYSLHAHTADLAGAAVNGWSTLGNAGTIPPANFMGTTDNQPLFFRTNNVSKLFLDNDSAHLGVSGTGALFVVQETPVSQGASLFLQSHHAWQQVSDAAGFFRINDATAGQPRMSIDSMGRVGIGTTAPTNLLHVVNTTTLSAAGLFQINNASNASNALYATTNGTSAAGNFQINNASNSQGALIGQTNGTGSALYGLSTGNGNAGNFQISNSSNNQPALYVTTNGTGASAVFTGGNVGIGITVPKNTLSVVGSLALKKVSVNASTYSMSSSDCFIEVTGGSSS
ncbi:MAG: hypothetical protein HY063_05895, partial [Bacteroidetes bacterium]|nr:hypothetical protein [Bacteroidota bacterium]